MSTASRFSRSWAWALLVAIMLCEFLLFDRMTSRHHAGFYPRWNDQIQYLTEAYQAHDAARAQGLLAGLKIAFTKDAVQGQLHDVAAVIVFALTGSASRSAALSLNMLVFLAWQFALWFSVTRVTGSRAFGWLAFGLVLCLGWPWSVSPGSAIDFRLDHAAMCLFGLTGCLALLSDGFRHRGWSIALGLGIALTLLTRFLTVVYFAPIFVAAIIWVVRDADRAVRTRGLGWAAVVAAVVALPFFWINRQGILDYYWVGHVTGNESAARAPGLSLLQSLEFLRDHLLYRQLGPWLGWTTAAVTAALVLLWFALGRRANPRSGREWRFVALVFTLSPTIILTLHRQKSDVTLGIIVPGVLLLVLWVWDRLWPQVESSVAGGWRKHFPTALAVATVATGLFYFTRCQLTPPPVDFTRSARAVNSLADFIFDRVQRSRSAQPSVGVDRIVDFVDGRILRVICYERHRAWVLFGVHLPDSILTTEDSIIMFKLRETDFMFLSDPNQGHASWPYDLQMRRLYPQLKQWCDENMDHVSDHDLFGYKMSLYSRRPR